MRGESESCLPQARTEGLVIRQLPEEVLVYDLDRDKAHCLNQTAALVWQHCDGQTSVAELVQILEQEMHTPVPAEVVWLALQQLGKARLLTERVEGPGGSARLSRREVMRRLGWAAAVTAPLVTSIVAPTASQAASCLSSGSACTAAAQCCSGGCINSVCL
jgi:hypothetical protein